MTERGKQALIAILAAADMYLQTMPRHHPDGTPRTPEDMKSEVKGWLKLVLECPPAPTH